ncbi:MAG: phosphate signaling complex protein PhoU [Deltaproteobacteria bacterium]|nr:phosphate signaling complex protein PhoU [Deltaproteobacteria bacterium]
MSIHLKREIDNLKKLVLALGAMVEDNVAQSVKALSTRDAALADRISAADQEVDRKEVELEEECLKILALHQPVAIDLRFVIAVLKINNDLERIGDLAVNIAERSQVLSALPPIDIPFDFAGMTEMTQGMLKDSLDALVNMNTRLAWQVCARDDDVDAINRQMYHQVQDGIRAEPDRMEALIHCLSTSRHLERIADHATNIAEDVIYMAAGEIVRHKAEDFRPQGEDEGEEP